MIFDKDFDSIILDLQNLYECEVRRADELQEKLDGWNKDAEIQKYKDRAENISRHSLISLSDKELESEKAFRKKHYESCARPLHSKAAGNTYIYEITGTGIGTIITVKCPICGESEDITDISSW